jgi:two-component system sensor histidine kinase UhpB
VRNLMADLRPPVLDDYGLLASLRWLAEQWESVATMQIAVDGSAPEPTLSREVQIALFRITQEALNNAARHAQAKRVTVRLEHDAGAVCGVLTITDDGRGFDPRAGRRAGWGLDNMRARANAIDGAFQIDSQAGCGTTVRVVVPLHAATATELSGAPEHAGAAIEVQHG